MKFNKLMFAALALGALAMVSCKKKDEPVNPIPGGGGGSDPEPETVPIVDNPGDGKATLVIHIPEGTECNGIAFKGTLDGAEWSGANTYVGETSAQTPAADAIKFEAIEGSKVWWKATYNLGEVGLRGKICLIYTDDGSWQGQAVNWNTEEYASYSTSDISISGDGNIEINTAGLVYVEIGGWQNSECATLSDYKVTVITPAFCDGEFPIELVGSFEGWGGSPVALTKVAENKFQATIKAGANAEVKVRGEGGWDKEIKIYDTDADEWKGVDNFVLTNDLNPVLDYSGENYGWNVCVD